jgi:hypothetical protein
MGPRRLSDPSSYEVTANDDQETHNGELVDCVIKLGTKTVTANGVSAPGFQLQSCSPLPTGIGAARSHPVGFVDYGTGVPSGQRTARSWLLSSSKASPHEGTSETNTQVTLWNHPTANGPLTPSQRVTTNDRRLDAVACTTFSPAKPMSYAGGMSLDYCEDCDRLITLEWGVSFASDVTCF